MTRSVYPSAHTKPGEGDAKAWDTTWIIATMRLPIAPFFVTPKRICFHPGWDRFADQYGKGVDTNEYSFDGVPERPLSGFCNRKDIYNKGLFLVKRNISQSVHLATTHPLLAPYKEFMGCRFSLLRTFR